MGACEFFNEADATTYPDAQSAFSALVRRARYDYGHAGYTGTIAEKHGFVMRNGGLPKHWDGLEEWCRKDADDQDKWGDAYCVGVCNDDGELLDWAFYGYASS